MTLLKEYRDGLLELLHDEPEQTFYELGIKKDDILLDEELINIMWARYQKYIQTHKENTPLVRHDSGSQKRAYRPIHVSNSQIK